LFVIRSPHFVELVGGATPVYGDVMGCEKTGDTEVPDRSPNAPWADAVRVNETVKLSGKVSG
jgi:hypothetical protein